MLVSLTDGDAKGILKGMLEGVGEADGFRAMLMFLRRFNVKTMATLMQAYLEVVNPPAIKGIGDVVGGIHRWEMKCTALHHWYGQELSEEIKTAILVGMLGKDLQELVCFFGDHCRPSIEHVGI